MERMHTQHVAFWGLSFIVKKPLFWSNQACTRGSSGTRCSTFLSMGAALTARPRATPMSPCVKRLWMLRKLEATWPKRLGQLRNMQRQRGAHLPGQARQAAGLRPWPALAQRPSLPRRRRRGRAAALWRAGASTSCYIPCSHASGTRRGFTLRQDPDHSSSVGISHASLMPGTHSHMCLNSALVEDLPCMLVRIICLCA